MLSFADARTKILENIAPIDTEMVPLAQAGGRILAQALFAPWDLPLWDNSAMDGFAVRFADCAAGATLGLSGYIPAGKAASQALAPGCAIKIMTGAPIPPGCDCVVPLEDATQEGETVRIDRPVKAGQHLRFRGEDIREGAEVLAAGTRLRAAEIGMLAGLGQVQVRVFRRPRVAVLATGDELVEVGEQLREGCLINCNSLALAASLQEMGCEPVLLGIARDDRESHREKLREGLVADALITSAGVSAGDRDLVKDVLEELGTNILLWKLAIKPGKPFAFGLHGKLPVFCLPGNPVATLVTFEVLARPALLKLAGHRRCLSRPVRATLTEEFRKKKGRLNFTRVRLRMEEGRYLAGTAGMQSSAILSSLSAADGLAMLSAEGEIFKAGEEVDVHLLGCGALSEED